MKQFELFTMIFYALDAVWNDTKDYELGQFLSGANPFLFLDIGSADPAVYADFQTKTPESVEIKESYDVAVEYLKTLKNDNFVDAFLSISKEEWEDEVKDYLAEPHKC